MDNTSSKHYTKSPRKRLGNWLAGSKHKWVRAMSDWCYTPSERRFLQESAEGIAASIMKQTDAFNSVLQANPDLVPLLRTFTLPSGKEKYDLFTVEAVLVFNNMISIQNMVPFLKEFASTVEGYKVCTIFIARLPWWLNEKGYFDIGAGTWNPGIEQEDLEAASQLICKDLAGVICKEVPGNWQYDAVVARLLELI